MQIHIQTNGQTTTLTVEPSATVASVKAILVLDHAVPKNFRLGQGRRNMKNSDGFTDGMSVTLTENKVPEGFDVPCHVMSLSCHGP